MGDIIDLYIGKENVKTIIEAGACDCTDSVRLAEAYPNAHIYAFEPNPSQLPLCRTTAEAFNALQDKPRITLTEQALSAIDGPITFYPIDTKKTITTHTDGNPGASSIFKASGLYPTETYVQTETTVMSTTLNRFCINNQIDSIDLMHLDAQGAELSILKGLGERVNIVKVIKTEVNFKEQYTLQPLFYEVEEYLEGKGFRFVRFLDKYEFFGDAVFLNNNL